MKALIIARKDLRSLFHEKTLLLAILIQLFIATFAGFLIVGISAYIMPEALGAYNIKRTSLVVVSENPDHEFIDFLASNRRLRVSVTDDFATAVDLFYKNEIDGFLVLPDFDARSLLPLKFDLYLTKNDISGTQIASALKDSMEEYESYVRRARSKRLPLDLAEIMTYELAIGPIKKPSSHFEFIYGILIPLLALAPALISGGLVIDLLTDEFERKTIEILRASPLRIRDVVNGKVLLATSLAPVQSLLWLSLVRANRIPVHNLGFITLTVAVITAILVSICAVISLYTKNRGSSHFLYSLLLFVLFFAAYRFHEFSPLGLLTRLSLDSFGLLEIVLVSGYILLLIPTFYVLENSADKSLD